MGTRARAASHTLAAVGGAERNAALHVIADQLEASTQALKEANAKDLAAGKEAGLAASLLDRLELTDARLASMIHGVRDVAAQDDPVGRVDEGRVLPNGIRLEKRRVPIGTILIIYESRPNVTADAAALCLKSGNAVILRGGKEAIHSNAAIARIVQSGLKQAGLPADAVQLVATTDRAAIGHLLALEDDLDLCIPRGGEALIRAVVEQARIPVIKHYTGNCHVYVHADADVDMARAVCLNAKTQRTGVCNAAETFLFHADTANSGVLNAVLTALLDAGVELRGDARACAVHSDIKTVTDDDYAAEFLSMTAAVRVVDSLDQAVHHINHFGSRHTDAILTQSLAAADTFTTRVDTANAFVNCSTRFSDGQQYGLGAEIGISTDKLHARGPMGAADLTTTKWIAYGTGHVRE